MNSTIITGYSISSSSFFIANLISKGEKIVVFTPSREIGEDFFYITKNFYKQLEGKFFNISKFFPFSSILREKWYVPEFTELLYQLIFGKFQLIVVPISVCLKKFILPQLIAKESLNIRINEEIDREALIFQLVEWGYSRENFVFEKGEFAVRGDILDIYCPIYEKPVRIVFFGDTVETINFFNPQTQRRLNNQIKSIDIVMATEVNAEGDFRLIPELNGVKTTNLFSYISNNYKTCIYDYELCIKNLKKYEDELKEHLKEKDFEFEKIFFKSSEIIEEVEKFNFKFSQLSGSIDLKTEDYSKFHIRLKNNFKPLVDEIIKNELNSVKTIIFLQDEKKEYLLKDIFRNNNIRFSEKKYSSIFEFLNNPFSNVLVTKSDYNFNGFFSENLKVAIFSEKDIFAKKIKKTKFKIDENLKIRNFSELKEGDYIVHLQHGIGIFRGLKNLEFGGVKKDFFIIEYAGNDRLYVPIDKTGILQKYVGKDGYIPVIDKLGSTRWQKEKEKVLKATELIAKDILELYAKRKLLQGISFKCDETIIEEFANKWEYTETDDQLKAIEEVFSDMDNPNPMDRLLCGDVGFGKTEVAIRAILKAVICGYQVAFLVPTTILALQHFDVLSKRFSEYPFIIKKLTRFESKKEQKEIIKALSEGRIDIVIGTHRLLQDDVKFKNLGLLIIDEEHKFGVKHKEKIKMLKSNIDVLYMTATPIPRTLQMSLIGIKDLSVIQTPPADRKSIETKIVKFDKNIIKSAILKELSRDGQVFFVHNIVKSIYPMANFLKKLVPEAKIAVAHGQMKEAELEKIMKDFIEKKYNVLVCTTIIESGLDIPNVNTIIINRADKFGLSQLYQLRGRVGRTNIKAYAYLIIPPEDVITEKAIRRLRILQQHSNLSEGLKIALNDLELRGAGNLFGKEQSGRILAVGYEFFLDALESAIKRLKGEVVEEKIDPEISVWFPFYFPDNYIEDEKERFYYYKKISLIENEKELYEIKDEIIDKFGKLPFEAENLFQLFKVKVILKRLNIPKASIHKDSLILTIDEKSKVNTGKIVELINLKKAKLLSQNEVKIFLSSSELKAQIDDIKKILNELKN